MGFDLSSKPAIWYFLNMFEKLHTLSLSSFGVFFYFLGNTIIICPAGVLWSLNEQSRDSNT